MSHLLTTWTASAAGNTLAPPDGFPEGMIPRVANNSFREVMAQVSRLRDQYQARNWTAQALASITDILSAAWCSRLGYWFIGGKNGLVRKSADGRAWSSTPGMSGRAEWMAEGVLASGAPALLAVDDAGAIYANASGSFALAGLSATLPQVNARIAYGNKRWVVSGGGGIAQSADPVNLSTWRRVNSVSGVNFNGLAWSPEKGWCAAGASGSNTAIYTSPDGLAWSSRQSGVAGQLNAVAWFPNRSGPAGLWIAVGANGSAPLIYTSPDGIAWTARSSSLPVPLRAVSPNASGSLCIVAGEQGVLELSLDGTSWSRADVTGVSAGTVFNVITSGRMPGGDLILLGGTPDGTAARVWSSRIV